MTRLRSSVLTLTGFLFATTVAQASPFWTAAGNLTYHTPRDVAGKHFVEHALWLEAGKVYALEMHSPHFDTFLRLRNAAGFVVAQNDDGGPALNSKLVFRPVVTGAYRLVATSFRPNETGSYHLHAIRSGGIVLDIHGDLRFGDPVYAGRHLKNHRVFLHAGHEYVINLDSPHFDTLVKVTTTAGVVLARNDDGGPALNSRLIFRPAVSGHYDVVATSYATGATGHFHLKVRD